MYWDRIEINWNQFRNIVKEHWGQLTDEQVNMIMGKRDRLAGTIQEVYDVTRDEAEKQVSEWQRFQKLESPG